jgi:hypothetical protein
VCVCVCVCVCVRACARVFALAIFYAWTTVARVGGLV